MKPVNLFRTAVLMSLSTLALAQSEAPKPAASMAMPQTAPQTDAQKSFAVMKSLAGAWIGPATVEPPMKGMGDDTRTRATLHVTSRGNALTHEMQEFGKPDDPARYDHPLTTFYLDNDRLVLTHYCDAGNRPRMTARASTDGKTIEFDFLDVAGSTKYGHMQHAVFTIVDANHHIEDWTYLMPGDKPVHARLDLRREQQETVGGSK